MRYLLDNLELIIEQIRLRIEHKTAENEPFDNIETDLIVYERFMLLYMRCKNEE